MLCFGFSECHITEEAPVLTSSRAWQPGSPKTEGSFQKWPAGPQFLNCLHHVPGDIPASGETGGIFKGAFRDKPWHTERRNTEKGSCWAGLGKAQQVWELSVQWGVGNWKTLTAQNSPFGFKAIFLQPVYHPLDMMCLGHETIINITFHPEFTSLPLIASKLGPSLFISEFASSSNSWMRFGSFNTTGHFVCPHTATVLPYFIVLCLSVWDRSA